MGIDLASSRSPSRLGQVTSVTDKQTKNYLRVKCIQKILSRGKFVYEASVRVAIIGVTYFSTFTFNRKRLSKKVQLIEHLNLMKLLKLKCLKKQVSSNENGFQRLLVL